jgi:hypothetical protein
VDTFFQFSSGNFNAATLSVGDETYALAISRDARYVVGISDLEATLWNVTTPGAGQELGIPAGRGFSSAHAVSSGATATVIGYAGGGSFVWTQAAAAHQSGSHAPFTFIDTSASNRPLRFYRVVPSP